jgi:hypothetical protein
MYFTGLRVSNLLLLTVRNIKELMYDSLGSEIQIIKGGRSNQLISFLLKDKGIDASSRT